MASRSPHLKCETWLDSYFNLCNNQYLVIKSVVNFYSNIRGGGNWRNGHCIGGENFISPRYFPISPRLWFLTYFPISPRPKIIFSHISALFSQISALWYFDDIFPYLRVIFPYLRVFEIFVILHIFPYLRAFFDFSHISALFSQISAFLKFYKFYIFSHISALFLIFSQISALWYFDIFPHCWKEQSTRAPIDGSG
jgi:hypothetical protein